MDIEELHDCPNNQELSSMVKMCERCSHVPLPSHCCDQKYTTCVAPHSQENKSIVTWTRPQVRKETESTKAAHTANIGRVVVHTNTTTPARQQSTIHKWWNMRRQELHMYMWHYHCSWTKTWQAFPGPQWDMTRN